MKSEYKKIKSLSVIIIMLFSIMTAVVVTLPHQNVNAAAAIPKIFEIDLNYGAYSVNPFIPLNITWNASIGVSTYNITIVGERCWTYSNTSDTYYNWNIVDFTDPSDFLGINSITLMAYNASGYRYADGGNITFIVAPGVNVWGDATTALTYTTTSQSITVNTSSTAKNYNHSGDNVYYICYPVYHKSAGGVYNLSYVRLEAGGAYKTVTVDSNAESIPSITLNHAGMWILANQAQVDGGKTINASNVFQSDGFGGFFWVNSSRALDIEINQGGTEVVYGQNESITITVTEDGSAVDCWIDVYDSYNYSRVIHYYSDVGGIYTFSSAYLTNLTYAGNYTVHAYYDIDTPIHGYTADSTFDVYCHFYGYGMTVGGENYTAWGYCGPWDPPEKNASTATIKVATGEPTTSIPEANATMYWGFNGQVNITVKDYNNHNISVGQSGYTYSLDQWIVYNQDDEDVTADLTITSHIDAGYILIDNADAANATLGGWGRDATGATFGENGTWTIYLYKDVDGDAALEDDEYAMEWNTSVYITVTNSPGLQWKWVDDDGVNANYPAGNSNNDGVIPEIPPIGAPQPLSIQFQIIGDDHSYYGTNEDGDAAAPENYGGNISVSGNALYLPTTLDELPDVTYASGTWTVPLTPVMVQNGGEITFDATWDEYGSMTETLSIGGSKLNGSIVTISPTEFTYGTDTTITVNVKTATGLPAWNAQVWLYWVFDDNGTLIDNNNGIVSYLNGGGSDTGDYTFTINSTMQKANQTGLTIDGTTYKNAYGVSDGIRAPRNISAYVKLYDGGTTDNYVYGYALTEMKAQSNLKVTMEPSTVMAGQKISKFWWNTTKVDSTGNTTGYPADSGLKVRIYNSTGSDVTDTIGSLVATTDTDGNDNKTATNEYIQEPGTYTVCAYNNTCNSWENNATLVVQPVTVTCDLSELIWNVDDNVTAIFTVKYNGEPINGTLRLDNMTDNGSYNGTWYLCNFTPDIGQTTGADAENTSIEVTVTNGVVTIHNITAENLWPASIARRNISYYFKSKTSGSAWAHADGQLPVKIANVAASPDTIVLNEASDLTITVTGRGAGLEDVWVSLGGAVDDQNGTTSADGTIIFSVVPSKTGAITIAIENRTSDTEVLVTNWKLYIDSPAQANEGASFTVTVKNGTADGGALTNVYVTFNRETQQTNSEGKATFTAPTVGTSGAPYPITATATGYKEDSETIQINNVPQLIIAVTGEVKAGQTFTIVIADDTGGPVIGATITINGETYTTGAGGVATITAPAKGTYTVTATFPGFESATQDVTVTEGGIPGFELLTLVAALGVAFLLLRRRRK